MVENVTQIKSGITINVGVSAKIQNKITCVKKIIFRILFFRSCDDSKYVGSIIDNPVITCDEIINAAESASTNVSTNLMSTVSTNVASNASLNFYNRKVRYKIDFYILHTVLSVPLLLFIIIIIYNHYAKHRSKQKNIDTLTI